MMKNLLKIQKREKNNREIIAVLILNYKRGSRPNLRRKFFKNMIIYQKLGKNIIQMINIEIGGKLKMIQKYQIQKKFNKSKAFQENQILKQKEKIKFIIQRQIIGKK